MSIWVTALSTYSTTREKVLEHRFIADVTAELWRCGVFDFAVSHSEVDNSGYDVVIEANGITRHLQLKAMQVRVRVATSRFNCAWRTSRWARPC